MRKQKRSFLNAFKHGLSGNHMVLQKHELAAYEQLTVKMLADLKPVSEPEKQIARKIVDLNFRINRITAIENNMLNFDMGPNEPDFEEDEGIARMMGQARAWKQEAHSFEILGRYEARLSKQLLQYQKELERLKAVRIAEVHATSVALRQTTETAQLNHELASFGKPAPAYVMSAVSQTAATTGATPRARPAQPAPGRLNRSNVSASSYPLHPRYRQTPMPRTWDRCTY